MILEDTPLVEGITTVHFPDVQANYFRLLLDFLYSGETYVPANEVDYVYELLALLEIKSNVWRSGNKKDQGNFFALLDLFGTLLQNFSPPHRIT